MTDKSTDIVGGLAEAPKNIRPADLDDVDRRILSLLHADA